MQFASPRLLDLSLFGNAGHLRDAEACDRLSGFPWELGVGTQSLAAVFNKTNNLLSRRRLKGHCQQRLDRYRSPVHGVLMVFLVTYVVPTFANLYNSMQAKLPLMTVYLIAIGTASQKYIVFFAAGLVGAFFLFRWWARRDSAKQIVDRIKLRMPLVGEIWLKYQVAQ